MSCGKNDRSFEPQLFFYFIIAIDCIDPIHLIIIYKQICHFRLKVHLASTAEDGVAHVLDDARQFVCSNVWMRID